MFSSSLVKGGFPIFCGVVIFSLFTSCSQMAKEMSKEDDRIWLESRKAASTEDVSAAIKNCVGVSAVIAAATTPLSRGDLSAEESFCLEKTKESERIARDAKILLSQKTAINN